MPARTNAAKVAAYRQRNIDAGLCRYSGQHGPQTHGTLCDACYAKNQAHLIARRHRIKQNAPTDTALHDAL